MVATWALHNAVKELLGSCNSCLEEQFTSQNHIQCVLCATGSLLIFAYQKNFRSSIFCQQGM